MTTKLIIYRVIILGCQNNLIYLQKHIAMHQIYNTSDANTYRLALTYEVIGVYARVAQCYEKLLYNGTLGKISYLRLIRIYIRANKTKDVQRILKRYITNFK